MYVFLMDRGQLVSLKSDKLSKNVSSLRNVLFTDLEIPLDRQILLVSGGFQLEPGDKLSKYDAGLDKTNPIYVFTRAQPNDQLPQKPCVLEIDDGGYPRLIEGLLQTPPSLATLNERLRVVHALGPVAHQTRDAIEQLVAEQGQMIQGWCVALASLAEVAADANNHLQTASDRLAQFESCASEWDRKLHLVNELKQELCQVPLLPQLLGPLKEAWNQNLQFHPLAPIPSNLYDWFCLQSTLSFGIGRGARSLRSGSARHLHLAHTLIRPEGPFGRPRTTSVGDIGQTVNPPDKQMPSDATPPVASNLQDELVSHPSGDNLFAVYTHSPSSDRRRFVPDNLDNEHDFLDMINAALRDLHFLRHGEAAPLDDANSRSNEMTYARRLVGHLEELLSLVPSSSMVTPTNSGSEGANSMSHPTEINEANWSGIGDIDFDVSRQASVSDRTHFSQLLARLGPRTEEARQALDLIERVERNLAKTYQRACMAQNISVVCDQHSLHTSQLRELLATFKQLCEIFYQTMDSKLLLADYLQERQLWLQKFQSDIHRLDANIHRCLSRMDRIIRTGTLISQLQSAPEFYARCLVEVVRQTEFEANAIQVAREQRTSRTEEKIRRRQFARQLRDNILHSLFAPWTTSSRGSRFTGSIKTLNTSEPDSHDMQSPTGLACTSKLSQLVRLDRTSLNSRSESHLNELANSPTILRTGSRGRPKDFLRAAAQRLAEVDENESSLRCMEAPYRGKHLSGDAAIPSQTATLQQHRVSLPSGASVPGCTPKWILGEAASTEEDATLQLDFMRSSMYITREDLDKLSTILPSHLSEIIREELSRTSTRNQLSFVHPPTLSCSSSHSVLETTSTLIVAASSKPDQLESRTSNAACQTDLPNFLQSSATIWSPQRHSLSLVLHTTESPRRTLPFWEPVPSSLCSWEFCPGPSGRSGLKRWLSTNVLMTFTSTTAKITLTDSPDAAAAPILESPLSVHPEQTESSTEVLVVKAPVLTPPLSSQSSASDLPNFDPIVTDVTADLGSLTLNATQVVDEICTENEYATPHTMMSSSFHSTRTNLSTVDDVFPDTELGSVLPLDIDAEGLGCTPTQTVQSKRLTDRGVVSPSLQAGFWSHVSHDQESACSCGPNQWHSACIQLASDIVSSNHSTLLDCVSRTGCPFNREQLDMLDQLLNHLTNYARSYLHPPCPMHHTPTGRSVLSLVELPVTLTTCSLDATSQVISTPMVSSAEVQVNMTSASMDKSTCITPPREMTSPQFDGSTAMHVRRPSATAAGGGLSSSMQQSIMPIDIVPLTALQPLSVMHPLQRFFTFAHCNFTCNDPVVFIPVRGSTAHISPMKFPTIAPPSPPHTADPPVSPSACPPQSTSSASTRLSSAIIQSMDTSVRTSMYHQPMPSSAGGSGMMHTSLAPLWSKPNPGLILKDLFDVPALPTRSAVGNTAKAVTQWRMLSSDGHVYFLHQDDFAVLNLDASVDYCQPVISTLSSKHSSQSQSSGNIIGTRPHPEQPRLRSSLGGYFLAASYQHKEHCLSKRKDNRFNLPIDFSFYRVRVKPLKVPSDLESALTPP